MRATTIVSAVALSIPFIGAAISAGAQQPQIPTLQVCNQTQLTGSGTVNIARRSDAVHSGVFKVEVKVACNPSGTGYPDGRLVISVDMSDSFKGTIASTTIEQLTSTGKHTPTAYLSGRCKADGIAGCRFWLMVADNKGANAKVTPDVVGFLVFNGVGKRVAYGTGPVAKGDYKVSPTSN